MPRPVDVGVGTALILLNTKHQLLLGKRKGAHASGCWSVPGGWFDRADAGSFGSSHPENLNATQSAASSECEEEVGIRVDPENIGRVGWSVEQHAEFASVTLYHCAQLSTDEEPELREPEKCEEWRWFDLDHLPTPLFPGLSFMLGLWQHMKKAPVLEVSVHGSAFSFRSVNNA